MKKNILIDYRWSGKSGIGTMVDNLLPHLCQKFNTVYLLSNDDNLSEKDNIKIIKIHSKIYSPLEQFEILFKKPKNCDFFWFPNYNAPIFLLKNKFIHIHDLSMLDGDINIMKRIYAYFLIFLNIKTSTKIFTVSKFSKINILNKFRFLSNTKRIKVVYNGVSDKFFEISKEVNHSILSVGIVKKRKNFIVLVNAFKKLVKKKNFKDYKLFIVGQKEGMNDIDKNVIKHQSDNIIFTGKIPYHELLEYYKRANIFVFPTKFEGFGIPLIEAMASGTPVVCSDISVLREVGEDVPIYFDPKDDIDLENKIYNVLNDHQLAEQMSNNGKKIAKNYNWKESASKLINIIYGDLK